jgi:hypothetical protein
MTKIAGSGSGSINLRHGSGSTPRCHRSGTLVDGHPIFSFDTDTGLKQALATVNDYNPLMKDFPINDLLSATELDRIRTSVQVPLDFFQACGTVPFHYIQYSYISLTENMCEIVFDFFDLKLVKIFCSLKISNKNVKRVSFLEVLMNPFYLYHCT